MSFNKIAKMKLGAVIISNNNSKVTLKFIKKVL